MARFLQIMALFLVLCAGARGEVQDPIPAPTPVDVGLSPAVRVLVYQGPGPVVVSGPEGITLQEGVSAEDLTQCLFPPEAADSGGPQRHWSVRGAGLPLSLDGRPYRGDLEVFWDGTTLQVVNRVGLEDYLRGVVPRELLSSQLEAVKAQAVVSRTYVLAHLKGSESRFDVRDDVGHQVYGGAQAEHPTSDRAVQETAGLVLAWQGRLASRVVFHSTCGGQTEGNDKVFGTPPVAYLRGVDCLDGAGQPSCAASSYATWTAEWSGEELGQEVGRSLGKPPAPVRGLEIREAAPSGRVVRLGVLREGEEDLELTGDALRSVLRFRDPSGRVRNLPSTRFEVEPVGEDGRIRIRGSGWGHGVGMCQWGAMGLAREGRSFEEILGRYYPGTRVLWSGSVDPVDP